MQLIRSVNEMRALAEEKRGEGATLALVPTMGALHEGHLQLVREAKERADHVTVSIYVNPTQFAPTEDLERYPRVLGADLEMLDSVGGVEAVFAPAEAEMYPPGAATWVVVEELTRELCGRYREGHFRGVTTIVTKLLIVCRPHVVLFGLKDAQQFFVVRRMAKDLGFGTRIVGIPTMREEDGLALSSRNRFLTEEARRQAVVVSQAVEAARGLIKGGEQRSEAIVEAMRSVLGQAPLARPQYVEVVDTERIQPVRTIEPGQEVLAAVAVYFGDTRLIDNVIAQAPQRSS